MPVSNKDREILHSLAFHVREIADSEENLIKVHECERLESMQHGRPLIFCSPEGAWTELLPMQEMQTSTDELRQIEFELRQKIFWAEEICDDMPISREFSVGLPVIRTEFGVTTRHINSNLAKGAYTWIPPITNIEEQFHLLKFREFTADRPAADRKADMINDIFGDCLTPEINCGGAWWSLGICEDAIKLVGLENFMLFMYDDPEGMHRLMSFLRDDHINAIKWFEKTGNFVEHDKPVKISEKHGFCEAQEAVGVSPEMFNEFIMQYQIPIVKDFAVNAYGCCEAVHDRWQYIKPIPRLNRVSISPWCNQEIMADALKRDYIYNRKPNPSPVCVGFDEKVIRDDLRYTIKVAGECLLEMILKDTHTVQNDRTRFKKYVKIAREEIANG